MHNFNYSDQVIIDVNSYNCVSLTCPVLIGVATKDIFPYFHEGHRLSLVTTVCVKVLCTPSMCRSSIAKTPLKLTTQPLYDLFDIFYISV